MKTSEPEQMIEVSESWLRQLADLTKKVHDQIEDLPPEALTTLTKTDVYSLLGYASSARTIVNLKGVARRNNL